MSQRQRMIAFLCLDFFLLFCSVFISYFIRFEGKIPDFHWDNMPFAFLLIASNIYFFLYLLKAYRRSWRYASIDELVLIMKGISLALGTSVLCYLLINMVGVRLVIPQSIFALFWMTSIAFIGGSRFIWRVYGNSTVKMQPHHKKALVVGAGSAGTLVVKELLKSFDTDLFPVAFIDDNPKKVKLELLGIPIVGNRHDILRVVEQYGIDTIIIAMPSVPREEVAKLIALCKETGANIKLLPRVSDVIHGKVSISLIRDVHVEDLLGRDSVQTNLQEISDYITGKIVLVTGAGGSIGSELCRQISYFAPQQLLLVGHGENSIYLIENELRRKHPQVTFCPIIADIQDRLRMESIFELYRPHIVFHAAAHKHVPLMESNVVEAIKNNVFGTKNVAECAHKYGAEQFVSISSDKAVNPTSVMGATKRISEMMIQSLDKGSKTKFTAVRFGNVLGSRGSVIPLFKQQIQEGGPVTVTHPDMVRFFMTIPEAVQLVIQAGALSQGGEVFILDMGEPVKISDLANDLIRLSGLKPGLDIQVVYTGMRPGEKLYEEILTREEGATASRHNRIFIGRPNDFSAEDFSFFLRKLEQLILKRVTASTTQQILVLLHQIVPTYQGAEKIQSASLELIQT